IIVIIAPFSLSTHVCLSNSPPPTRPPLPTTAAAAAPGGGGLDEHPDPLYTRCVLLGSDGLWDVMAPNSAVNTAAAFHEYYDRIMASSGLPSDLGPYDKADRPLCSAERLVQCALSNEHQKGSTDNVTAICVFVEPGGADRVAAAAQQQQQ